MDELILGFRHCGSIIYCFQLPQLCPICKNVVSFTCDTPFRLPYPFVKAHQHPLSIVLKSTKGTFLEHYSCNEDLHIGITDCKGKVYEYDSDGLKKTDGEEWLQSIVVYEKSEDWSYDWSEALRSVASDPKWRSENYDEQTLNCFSFVTEFLTNLNCVETNKEQFCEEFVHKKIVSVKKYIKVHRKIVKDGYCNIKNE